MNYIIAFLIGFILPFIFYYYFFRIKFYKKAERYEKKSVGNWLVALILHRIIFLLPFVVSGCMLVILLPTLKGVERISSVVSWSSGVGLGVVLAYKLKK